MVRAAHRDKASSKPSVGYQCIHEITTNVEQPGVIVCVCVIVCVIVCVRALFQSSTTAAQQQQAERREQNTTFTPPHHLLHTHIDEASDLNVLHRRCDASDDARRPTSLPIPDAAVVTVSVAVAPVVPDDSDAE